jgi:transposase InsO family protein
MVDSFLISQGGQEMPFHEVSRMDAKLEFVCLAAAPGANVRMLCRRFGVSPTTGYKWLDRYRQHGAAGLVETSRRPHHSPWRCDGRIEAAVLELRQAHPAWGGRKLRACLAGRGLPAVPAASTITAILRRHGLPTGVFGGGRADWTRFEHPEPNDLWQMDHKGHVAMADGARLHPLTVLDDHSRFAVVLKASADQRTAGVRAALVEAFRRYGLPRAIITDNGSPWGDGPGSPWTPLGVFLIDQGVRIAHSRPYHPQTMGKDERFHRTLKAEAMSGPPFQDLAAAARAFARWRQVYNHERPHEALGLQPPASRYQASPRPYRDTPEPIDYGPDDRVRRVQDGGCISFLGRQRRVPKAFKGRDVALRPTPDDGVYGVFYRHQAIATLDFSSETPDPQTVHHVSEHVSTISPV